MLDIRYAAGLFDGEGYVRINEWHKPNSEHIRFNIYLGVSMTHRPVIEALRERFGGSINVNRPDLKNSKHRCIFAWSRSSSGAAGFLREVLPHLIIKKEEAEIALLLQDDIDKYRHKLGTPYGGYHPQRAEIFSYRRELAARVKALKTPYFAPVVNRGP